MEAPPLWELGVGAAVTSAPVYPAADQNQLNYLPFPLPIYRGEVFRADDQGVRARAVDRNRWSLDLGVSGAFPAESEDIDARMGMPDLDWIVELGPKLEYRLSGAEYGGRLSLGLTARGVVSFSFDASPRYEGLTLNPEISYARSVFDGRGRFFASIDSTFGVMGLNDYYYKVDSAFATASRPAYDARDGYTGTRVNAGMQYRLTPRINLFGFGQVGYYMGAANEDSPLHRADVTGAVGFGFTWAIFQSERKARF